MPLWCNRLSTTEKKTYDLGLDSDGKPALLTIERIRAFFFDNLYSRIKAQDLDKFLQC